MHPVTGDQLLTRRAGEAIEYGDPTWWWVPGRLAMRWLLEACGFEIHRQLPTFDGPPADFATINGYFVCGPGEPAGQSTHVSR